jgi:hypothetical protein
MPGSRRPLKKNSFGGKQPKLQTVAVATLPRLWQALQSTLTASPPAQRTCHLQFPSLDVSFVSYYKCKRSVKSYLDLVRTSYAHKATATSVETTSGFTPWTKRSATRLFRWRWLPVDTYPTLMQTPVHVRIGQATSSRRPT